MHLDDYADGFRHAAITRDDRGILTVRLHLDGGPLHWSAQPHEELPHVFSAIASDDDNRVVVLTGTGTTFIDMDPSLGSGTVDPRAWNGVVREGTRMLEALLAIPVPTIAAVNGPASVHAELAVLCDLVLAADHAYFQDVAHAVRGVVPGDGVQVIWPLLLGPNRGRHFLLTGQQLDAPTALALGVVAEVLSPDLLLPRALELAGSLARHDIAFLRNTRQVLVRSLRRAMADDLPLGLTLEAMAHLARQPSP